MREKSGRTRIFKLTATGMLIAVGILIPMYSPVKIVIEPASYTLASHVAIFIAMFISPGVAAGVTLGTALGFFLGGYPTSIVFRALSHIVWSFPGALYLAKIDKFNISWYRLRIFSFIVALVHGIGEMCAVSLFYYATTFPPNFDILWFLSFVGLGTVIHSMVDLEIANVVWLVLQKQKSFRELAR